MVGENALFRESLALLLEWRTGVECERAASFSGARRLLDDTRTTPHVAVVDLGPQGTGAGLLGRLGDVPVLALTAERASEHRARLIRAGADEVLPTASPLDEIVGAVQRLIRG